MMAMAPHAVDPPPAEGASAAPMDRSMQRQLTAQSSCTQASSSKAVAGAGAVVTPTGSEASQPTNEMKKTGSAGGVASSSSVAGDGDTFEISVVEEAEVVSAAEAEVRSLAAKQDAHQTGDRGPMANKKEDQPPPSASPPSAVPAAFGSIQPLLLHAPPGIPLGIDIDMVMPIVSYVQPSSPLRGHVEVGDILVFIDGKSTAELSHGALTRMLNGHKKHGDKDGEEGKGRKLIFLPGKYGRKLGIKPVANPATSEDAKAGDGNDSARADTAGSSNGVRDTADSPPAASSNVNDSCPSTEAPRSQNESEGGAPVTKEVVEGEPAVALTAAADQIEAAEQPQSVHIEHSQKIIVDTGAECNNDASKAISPSGTNTTMDTKGTESQCHSNQSDGKCPSVEGKESDVASTPKRKGAPASMGNAAKKAESEPRGSSDDLRRVEAMQSAFATEPTTDHSALKHPTPLSSRESSLTTNHKSLATEQQTFATAKSIEQTFHTCQSHSTPDGTGTDRSTKSSQNQSDEGGSPPVPAENIAEEPLPPQSDAPSNCREVAEDAKKQEQQPQQEVHDEAIPSHASSHPDSKQVSMPKPLEDGDVDNDPEEGNDSESAVAVEAKAEAAAAVPKEKRGPSPAPSPPSNLDEEDRRRWERRNRPAPVIEYVAIPSGDAATSHNDRGEDVSTIYGGRWDPTLHDMAGRRVEDALGYAEEGYGVASLVGGGGSIATRSTKHDPNTFSQLRMLGLAGPEDRRREWDERRRKKEHAEMDKDEREEVALRMKRQQKCVEGALVALIGLSVVALVVILVLVLRNR